MGPRSPGAQRNLDGGHLMVKALLSIQFVRGDATAPRGSGAKIIAHICNDLGTWGKGFVLALVRRWPELAQSFKQWYRDREENDFGLGAVQFVQAEEDLW